jgi:hypothetical protein
MKSDFCSKKLKYPSSPHVCLPVLHPYCLLLQPLSHNSPCPDGGFESLKNEPDDRIIHHRTLAGGLTFSHEIGKRLIDINFFSAHWIGCDFSGH